MCFLYSSLSMVKFFLFFIMAFHVLFETIRRVSMHKEIQFVLILLYTKCVSSYVVSHQPHSTLM